jgi:hypothetical protein
MCLPEQLVGARCLCYAFRRDERQLATLRYTPVTGNSMTAGSTAMPATHMSLASSNCCQTLTLGVDSLVPQTLTRVN